jgi:serine protease Do
MPGRALTLVVLTTLVADAALGGVACRERTEPLPEQGGSGGGSAGSAGSAAAAAATATSAQTRILYPSAPGSFVDLVNGARHGVVAIRAGAPVRSGPAAMFPGSPESASDVALGTGFLVESSGVYVLTNDHIAAATTDLRIVLPGGTEVPGKVIGRDLRLDLALISIDVPRLQPLPLGNSDEIATGEWVVVLGNAFGDELTAAVGIVSATGREAAGSLVPGRAMGFRTYLQTDARIHRGNSGGPVLDTAGQVVGVAVATGDRAEELSFAIPINRVREVIDALRESGTVARSWLGVLVKPVTAELAQERGLPKPGGALVTEIKAGSPAARSALRVGDVILKWGDREIDHRSLPWIVAQTPPGRPVAIAVWRNRAEIPVQLVTEKMPE